MVLCRINFLVVQVCASEAARLSVACVQKGTLVILKKSCRLLARAVCKPPVPVELNHFKNRETPHNYHFHHRGGTAHPQPFVSLRRNPAAWSTVVKETIPAAYCTRSRLRLNWVGLLCSYLPAKETMCVQKRMLQGQEDIFNTS